MKKAEAKTGSKVKKTTSAVKAVKSSKETRGTAVRTTRKTTATAVKSRKVKAVKPEPTIEEISMKAYEIYNQRISRGEKGSQTDDWHKAVELLKKG